MRNWLFSYSVPTNNDKLNLRKSCKIRKQEKIDLFSDLDHKKRLMVLCLSGSRGFENCFQVPFKPHELRWDGFLCSKIYFWVVKRRKNTPNSSSGWLQFFSFWHWKKGEGRGKLVDASFSSQKPTHRYSGVSGCTPVPFFLGLIPILNGLQSRCSFR